jgi:hypothetical protein
MDIVPIDVRMNVHATNPPRFGLGARSRQARKKRERSCSKR